MDATAGYKRRLQDLPPKGGYGPIQTERIKLRRVMGGKIFSDIFTINAIYAFVCLLTAIRLKSKSILRNNIFLSKIAAKSLFGLFITSTIVGFYGYYQTYLKNKRDQIEMRSARFAILPLLIAERDRA
jgi:hypothetical protein